jgi:hypothetical protein
LVVSFCDWATEAPTPLVYDKIIISDKVVNIYLISIYDFPIRKSRNNSLVSYYAFHGASAILSENKDKEIGKLFAESRDKLLVVDNEIKKEHIYSIPKTEMDHYSDDKVYLNISESSEFEILT